MSPHLLTDNQVIALISDFKIDAHIASVKPFGSGHINDTYRLINADNGGNDYLLQRVNHHVFRQVDLLMHNMLHVTRHLRQKLVPCANNGTLTIVLSRNDQPFLKDERGNYWRVFYFIKGTRSYDQVETKNQAFEGGKAFGQFVALLSDLDTGLIKDSIPNFHNIEYRLSNLQKAIEADSANRVKGVLPEIEFIKQRADNMSEILQLGKAGILPKRIVHNDTKFNNVLLDAEDKAQCVIDLDTVMPGFVAYDFGDSIRTIINTVSEDEADTDKISLNIPLFEAYTKGYLQEAEGFLTNAEKDSLIKGVLLMPFIQVVRFLTDYLEGDIYFKIHSPDHNLQRTRAQLVLVKQLEESQELLEQIINHTWQSFKSL